MSKCVGIAIIIASVVVLSRLVGPVLASETTQALGLGLLIIFFFLCLILVGVLWYLDWTNTSRQNDLR